MLHGQHLLLSVLGVQAFASGMAPWHVVALVMTSPFFVLIGAALFLREPVAPNRWLTASLGFAGAMILLRPWQGAITTGTLYPLVAAICWGGAVLITKRLTPRRKPDLHHPVASDAADPDQRPVFSASGV
jgi:S-adenosylmethionine uptake transporter